MGATNETLNLLALKHRLPIEKVKEAVDQVLCGRVFRHATSSDFGQISNEGVIVFRERGVSLLGELKRPLSRLLTGELEKLLTDAATVTELERWQMLHKQIVKAPIEMITHDGDIEVRLELTGVLGDSISEIIAICKSRNQSPRDRQKFRVGEARYFYVQKVNAVRCGDAPATISIELSRINPRFVELLIRKNLKGKQVSFKCVKRVVGKVSYISSQGFIPTDVIKQTGKELDERVDVEYKGNSPRKKG